MLQISLLSKDLRAWLATVLERVNNQIFKVEFEKIFLFYLWVFICVKVGYNNAVAGKKLRNQKRLSCQGDPLQSHPRADNQQKKLRSENFISV